MDAKDGLVFVLLLLSLGLFGSLTYCVWNKQTEVANEVADLQKQLHKLQNELKNMNSREHVEAKEPFQNKAQLKRNVRHADEDTSMPSATELLTNALTEIIERKLVSYMNCDKNEYNHTKCTLKPGPKGEPGPEGPTGEKGTKGEPGDMGLRGEPGDRGVKGSPGYPGFKGDKGIEGVVGPRGPTGPRGPPGIQGETGERGDIGQKGKSGDKGMKGDLGYPGYKGEKGVVGPQGPTGPQGLPGIQGKDGVKGEQGLVGPKGNTGPEGPRGPTGERGEKGDMGERGLKGDMGLRGPQGETGEMGIVGQKGEPGEKGMKGDQGYNGTKGEQGVAGPPAPTAAPTTAPTTATPGQCGGPGWRRVVVLNMTNTSHVCPTGLNLTSYSRRTCGRAHSGMHNCSSTTFSVDGSQYSRVCGRALAYRFGENFAFAGHHHHSRGIESQYVDGLSLTHGASGSRQHIWTFASGWFTGSRSSRNPFDRCPCDNANTRPSPPFVGNDYFCEGIHAQSNNQWIFYLNALLWDGQVCEGGGTCCKLNNPPWFTKNLTSPTTDDIELRLCFWDRPSRSDIALKLLELYVQ